MEPEIGFVSVVVDEPNTSAKWERHPGNIKHRLRGDPAAWSESGSMEYQRRGGLIAD
ncbi:hypothetical protein [Paraburkholderia sp. BR14374]|uniref:hypothetical protein n=1 Tax=Paraburkholderia sp. BR14374 TaxID=3237007 RepID=UPI0034CD082E